MKNYIKLLILTFHMLKITFYGCILTHEIHDNEHLFYSSFRRKQSWERNFFKRIIAIQNYKKNSFDIHTDE